MKKLEYLLVGFKVLGISLHRNKERGAALVAER